MFSLTVAVLDVWGVKQITAFPLKIILMARFGHMKDKKHELIEKG